jgi:hypothetical protein
MSKITWGYLKKEHPTFEIQRQSPHSVRVTVIYQGKRVNFYGNDETQARAKANQYLAEIGYSDD